MNLTVGQTQSLVFLSLGFVVVVLTSLLKREKWSRKTKHTIALIISTFTGLVSSYFKNHGTEDLESFTKDSVYLYAISQILYTYALSNTKINAWLTKFSIVGNRNSD